MIVETEFTRCQQRVDGFLASYLPPADPDKPLHEAIRYSVLAGGKRLRPLLIYKVGETLEVPLEKLDQAACAVELIHAYSLIHDDLPIMDNDDWRRNKPSCHKLFGSAIALLAGDALQALAFEVLLKSSLDPARILAMINVLAKAAGLYGMVGGQAMEFSDVLTPIDDRHMEKIYKLKTGSLFRAALELAGIIANVSGQALSLFAQIGGLLGQLYQLHDDMCDNDVAYAQHLAQTKKLAFQYQLITELEHLETLLPSFSKEEFMHLLTHLFSRTCHRQKLSIK